MINIISVNQQYANTYMSMSARKESLKAKIHSSLTCCSALYFMCE